MSERKSGDTRYALVTWLVIINALWFVFVAVMWRSGWIMEILHTDVYYVSQAVTGLFFVALIGVSVRIWNTSRELNITQTYVRALRGKEKDAQQEIESGDSRLAGYIADIRGLDNDGRREIGEIFADDVGVGVSSTAYMLARLAALGFIGTLFGIAVVLKIFDIPLTDPSQMLGVFNKVPPGLRVAVYPALLGGIGALWIDSLFEVLEVGTQKWISWVKKAGVYYAQQQSE